MKHIRLLHAAAMHQIYADGVVEVRDGPGLLVHKITLEGFDVGTQTLAAGGTAQSTPNTEDGGLVGGRSLDLQFEKLGRIGETYVPNAGGHLGIEILKPNLTGLGFDVSSFTIACVNTQEGGGQTR